jgi:hypothetical protein
MMKIIRPPLPPAGEGTGEGGTLSFPLTLILSLWRLCHNNKKQAFAEGERRSGGKDLERRPLNVRILAFQAYECIQLYTSDDFPYLKDPYSKSLEPTASPLESRLRHSLLGGRGGRGGGTQKVLILSTPTLPC